MGYNINTMHRKRVFPLFLLVALLAMVVAQLLPIAPVRAASALTSAGDLMAAVQALRASKGLAPLIVDASLSAAAQSHSAYQAAIGTWSHIGAGGTRPLDRAKAAGFGSGATVYVAENVAISNTSAKLDLVLYQYWGDPDHWNTMTNPLYIYGGAGVVEKNGVIYYTLDTGYVAGQAGSSSNSSGSRVQSTSMPPVAYFTPTPTVPLIVPVITSTRNPDGSLVHPVGYGQAMISIATAYGISLDDLRKINNMVPSSPLWAGQKLLIQPSYTVTPSPTITHTPVAPTRTLTPTRTPTSTPTPIPTVTATATETPAPVVPFISVESVDRRSLGTVIIAVCGLGLALVVFGQLRKKKQG
jgi:uncharacterized protein YkwD